jgi:hypothetical protein
MTSFLIAVRIESAASLDYRLRLSRWRCSRLESSQSRNPMIEANSPMPPTIMK